MPGDLQAAVAAYRQFLRDGGSRGSHAGRVHRERIGALVGAERQRQAKELRITDEDIAREVRKVEVFG